MYTDHFEAKFDEFLDAPEFEDTEETLFQLIRAAFIAGWIAAGGTPPFDSHAPDYLECNTCGKRVLFCPKSRRLP